MPKKKRKVIVFPLYPTVSFVMIRKNANRETAKVVFAANGGKLAVKSSLTVIKTIIAKQRHIIAGTNGLWGQPAVITVRICV